MPAEHNFIHRTGYESVMSFEHVKPRAGFEVTNDLNVYGSSSPELTVTNESDKVIVKFSVLCPDTIGYAVGLTIPWELDFLD